MDMIQTNRWSVLSWLSPFVALAILAFLFTTSIGQTQPSSAPPPLSSSASTTSMVCQLNSFFSFDANDQVRDLIAIEGRGLATCRNEQGLTIEIPVRAVLHALVIAPLRNSGELSFTANSSAFVIPYDIGQLQDRFDIKTYGSESSDRFSPALLIRGTDHRLTMQLKLTSRTEAFQKIQVRSVDLRIDDSAPTF